MFTERQVEVLEYVSAGACLGLVLGAVCGLLVSAVIVLMRRDRMAVAEKRLVLICGTVPAALAAATVASIISAVTAYMHVFLRQEELRGKSGGAPGPHEALVAAAFLLACLLPAAFAAAFLIPRAAVRQRSWPQIYARAVVWSVFAALIGAIAGIGRGFDGYFIHHSDSGPISAAIFGVLLVTIPCFLWRLAIASLPPANAPEDLPPEVSAILQ
jgi:hypothetical protein